MGILVVFLVSPLYLLILGAALLCFEFQIAGWLIWVLGSLITTFFYLPSFRSIARNQGHDNLQFNIGRFIYYLSVPALLIQIALGVSLIKKAHLVDGLILSIFAAIIFMITSVLMKQSKKMFTKK